MAALLDEGERLFPGLRERRVLRAYAGVRPLYEPPADDADGAGAAATPGGRMIRRSHVVIDHAAQDGVDDFVSIVGGKLTTYRLMAEQTVDLVMRKLGTSARCTTADEVLPGQEPRRNHWLGARLAAHEAAGGGDADLICECELVTRPELDGFLDERWPCSLDDVRRGTRLGMGPCQGGFCTFRAAGVIAEREARNGARPWRPWPALPSTSAEAFLEERLNGLRAVAWGRQLQEALLVEGLYRGVLGLPRSPWRTPSRRRSMPSADVVVVGSGLAGLSTAVRLAEDGARVVVVAAGSATLSWAGGPLDVAAVPPDGTPREGVANLAARPGHPYAVLAGRRRGGGRLVRRDHGARRPAVRGRPGSSAAAAADGPRRDAAGRHRPGRDGRRARAVAAGRTPRRDGHPGRQGPLAGGGRGRACDGHSPAARVPARPPSRPSPWPSPTWPTGATAPLWIWPTDSTIRASERPSWPT